MFSLHMPVFSSENKVKKKKGLQDWSSIIDEQMHPFVKHVTTLHAGAKQYSIILCKMDHFHFYFTLKISFQVNDG